jgi:hypothetical protein
MHTGTARPVFRGLEHFLSVAGKAGMEATSPYIRRYESTGVYRTYYSAALKLFDEFRIAGHKAIGNEFVQAVGTPRRQKLKTWRCTFAKPTGTRVKCPEYADKYMRALPMKNPRKFTTFDVPRPR